MHRFELSVAITADGTYALGTWFGAVGAFTVQGTFTGTVKLQFSSNAGVNYDDAGSETTLTATGGGLFELPPGYLLRVVASGFTGSVTAKAAANAVIPQTRT